MNTPRARDHPGRAAAFRSRPRLNRRPLGINPSQARDPDDGGRMRFIEVTEPAGVRTAVVRFRRPESPLRFLLLPRVPIGEAAFHREVTARLRRDCDLVVAEGAGAGSPAADAVIASYERLDEDERLGLVAQDLAAGSLGVPVVRPDTAGAASQQGHRSLPLTERVTLAALVPAVMAGMRLFGTRRYLARHLTTEDLAGGAEETTPDAPPGDGDLPAGRRDRLLVQALTHLHETSAGRPDPLTVGVLYGARHLRAASTALTGLGYHPSGTEWLTAFALDPPR